MTMPEPPRSDEPGTAASDPDTPYEPEVTATARQLQAHPADLRHLLRFIEAKQVARQQVASLLRQGHTRLDALRREGLDLAAIAARVAPSGAPIEQAAQALKSGEWLSVDRAYEAYEQAFQCCVEGQVPPADAARIRAGQAHIAAIRLEHRRAAELFGEAAAMASLDATTQWRYQTERALILEALGRDFVDNPALEEAIDLYENKILALAPRETRPDDWAATQNHLGTAVGLLGRRQSGTALLERSVAAFEKARAAYRRERTPLAWAATQNNLGNALGILGQRRYDIEMLERSAEAFELALEERTQERAPRDWAMTQNNLGAVLQAVGQRKKEPALLQRAIDAYKAALQEWTRERAPQDWATTLDNIGTALRLLGEHRDGARALEQSVAAYRNALTERTRGRSPQDWAMTQNNLGAALHKLGERQDAPAVLVQAIEAYENALQEWTRERNPFVWAMTKANLGAARKLRAQHARDADIARLAVADFEAVRDFLRNASHAQYYDLAEEQLAQALTLLAELMEG